MDFIFDDDVDEVGSEVEAFCPKCKADTTHVIMSKYEDEIRRVQCNPCGDVHAFRKPRGESEEEPAEPTKKTKIKAKPTWEQVMAKAKKDPKLYMVADKYSENELVSHPKFGVGFVSDVIGTDKIEVTFQAERRVLVHNRKGMSLPPAAYAHAVDATLPMTKERRKAAVKQAAVKSAAAHAKKAQETKPAKPAKPVKAAKPAAKPVKAAKPAAKPKAVAGRPTKAKAARAAAPARSKPAARSSKPVRAAAKKLKKR